MFEIHQTYHINVLNKLVKNLKYPITSLVSISKNYHLEITLSFSNFTKIVKIPITLDTIDLKI